jgi:2-polyprenyl-3-methyl-5-hydroxy-6-metoxy-1,4-benzoquinol methylase
MSSPEVVEGYHNQVRSDIVPFVPTTSGTLVDVGGGTGATAAHLRAIGRAGRAGAIDMVASSEAHPDLDFHLSGDLEDAAFLARCGEQEGPFDTILLLDVLEHLVDPWKLVAELHQVLAPGGHIVASIPNVRHYRVSAGLLFRNRWSLADAGILDRTHLRFFVRDTAVELMTSSGLTLESVSASTTGHRAGLLALVHKVSFGRLDSLVAVQHVVVVRRDA